MLFTTFTFTLFFLLVLLVWWGALGDKSTPRRLTLIAASWIFYGWADLRWLVALVVLGAVTTIGSRWIERARSDAARRRRGIALSVLVVGQLLVWKYTPWAVSSWNDWFSTWGFPVQRPEWAYPVGLSFFTFHALSLIFSVWIERRAALGWLSTWAHVSFFPALLAGPVLRRDDIEPRWSQSWSWREVAWTEAIGRIFLGMTFKWVLASQAANWADPIFQGLGSDPKAVWWGVHAYALQIFFDFAGYSHMALGLALMLGWRLPENFTQPYLALSAQEFWRRWHRSLSFFFRDYLYISALGGNRHGRWRTAFNGALTMVVSGLWHGANLTFLIWGVWHAALLLGQSLLPKASFRRTWWWKMLSWGITFELMVWGWVWFRAPDLESARLVFEQAWTVQGWSTAASLSLEQWCWMGVLIAFVALESMLLQHLRQLAAWVDQTSSLWVSTGGALTLSGWAWLIMAWGPVGVPAFIYNGF